MLLWHTPVLPQTSKGPTRWPHSQQSTVLLRVVPKVTLQALCGGKHACYVHTVQWRVLQCQQTGEPVASQWSSQALCSMATHSTMSLMSITYISSVTMYMQRQTDWQTDRQTDGCRQGNRSCINRHFIRKCLTKIESHKNTAGFTSHAVGR